MPPESPCRRQANLSTRSSGKPAEPVARTPTRTELSVVARRTRIAVFRDTGRIHTVSPGGSAALSIQPPNPTWTMRPYHPGDERDLVVLFQRVFGRPITEAHWRWKLKQLPS